MPSSLLLVGLLGGLITAMPLEDSVESNFEGAGVFLEGSGSSRAVVIFSRSLRILLAMNGINDLDGL